MGDMGMLEQEEVRVLMLDTRNRLLGAPMIYRGSLNAANMRVAEVFRDAIRANSASIIVAHNHPSGDPSPSADDVTVTRELIKAGKLLDIELQRRIQNCRHLRNTPRAFSIPSTRPDRDR